MNHDDDFTFGTKGKRGLSDFDGTKVKPAEQDMWESWVLGLLRIFLFVIGVLAIPAFLWWLTGKRD